jgi:hypothetical protein
MSNLDRPLDADELITLAERIAQLPAADAEWVDMLLRRVAARARARSGTACRTSQRPARNRGAQRRTRRPTGAGRSRHRRVVANAVERRLHGGWQFPFATALGLSGDRPRRCQEVLAFRAHSPGQTCLAIPAADPAGLALARTAGGPRAAVASRRRRSRSRGNGPGLRCDHRRLRRVAGDGRVRREQGVRRAAPGQGADLSAASGRRRDRSVAPRATDTTRKIHLQGHGGFHSYTLEWPADGDDGRTQFVPLRAATWTRAESEAEHWLASTHPELYGQVRFEICEL